jgi:hypothetical protein
MADYYGPTVYEQTCMEIRELTSQIARLQEKKRRAVERMNKYMGSRMLESERLATQAEPYQSTQLPTEPNNG